MTTFTTNDGVELDYQDTGGDVASASFTCDTRFDDEPRRRDASFGPTAIDRLLAANRYLVLGTAGESGDPSVSPVSFALVESQGPDTGAQPRDQFVRGPVRPRLQQRHSKSVRAVGSPVIHRAWQKLQPGCDRLCS
jgi:hypothetical protein